MPFWRAFSRPVTAALPIDPLYMRRLTYKMANSMHRCLPASLEMNLPMPDSSRSCSGSSPVTCDRSRYEGSVGITQFIFVNCCV